MSYAVRNDGKGWRSVNSADDIGVDETFSTEIPILYRTPTPQDLLNKLDADNTLTQRNLRETVMLMAEAFKQVTNGVVDLSTIPGVAKVYEVEAQAEALRAQL